jgi:acyl-CoA oxidase
MILPSIYSSTSREEKFVLGLKAGAVTFNDDVKTKDKIFQFKTHDGSLANANPFGLTLFLFAPFIKLQGTDEQIEKWVGMAERGEIIGCYTQSEYEPNLTVPYFHFGPKDVYELG